VAANFLRCESGPDACGPGCNKWIAADGLIDSGAAQRFRGFLAQPDLRSLPVFFNSGGDRASQSIAIGSILREYRMTASIGRTSPNGCDAAMPAECRSIAQSKPEQQSRLVTYGARCASAVSMLSWVLLYGRWRATPNLGSIPLDTWAD
jgi:hypothetical protein